MRTYRIAADKKIDPIRLDAWIHMNTVQNGNPSPGAAFIYVEDLTPAVTDEINPGVLQAVIGEKAITDGNPQPGIPFVYLDDLMEGFRGSRLEVR
jgi:hypothetical protein